MHSVNNGWNNRTARLTVDRIDNSLSYSGENIVLSCPRCNMIKSNYFSFEEMREIGQKYVKPRWKNSLKNRGLESTARSEK